MSPPGGASGEHSTFIHVAPSLPVDGLKVARGVKVRADTEVTGSKSYGWGIFDVFRNNLPLTIGVIAGTVGLIAGVVHWRKRERFYY